MKKRGSKYSRIGLLAALLLPGFLMAQDTTRVTRHEFSVQQAVDYAHKNNVQVKNALLDVQIQSETNREVTAAAYPHLSASGTLTYNAKLPVSLIPAEFLGGTPGTYQELAFGTKWNAMGGLSINQVLFDGQVFVGLQARNTVLDFSRKSVEVTEEMIKSNIYKIYYQLAVAKQQIQLLDSNIRLAEKLSHDTKVIYDNGFTDKLSVDQTNVTLANLKTDRQKVLNQVANGYLGLKILMGMPVKDELVLTDEVSPEMIREGALEMDGYKYEDRKEFQYAQLGIRLREYDIRRYKLAKLPTLNLTGYYNKNAQRNDFDFFKGGRWFDISAFSLNLNIPIFSGFANNARIQRAKYQLQQSQNEIDNLKLNIDQQVEVARNNYRSAVATVDAQQRNMTLAQTVYAQTKKKLEEGLTDQSSLETARVQLQAAQTNYISALYDAMVAKVDYLSATGKL